MLALYSQLSRQWLPLFSYLLQISFDKKALKCCHKTGSGYMFVYDDFHTSFSCRRHIRRLYIYKNKLIQDRFWCSIVKILNISNLILRRSNPIQSNVTLCGGPINHVICVELFLYTRWLNAYITPCQTYY